MFTIINIIIVIITGKSHARTWSTVMATTRRKPILSCASLKYEWRQTFHAFLHASGSRCTMAFFWSFPSNRRFPHCRQQSSPMIILREKLWQCDRINIIGFCWSNCSPYLNSVPHLFFGKMHQSFN